MPPADLVQVRESESFWKSLSRSRDIFAVAQAIKNLFDTYGDRSNKNKARLRFVLERFGSEKFIELYKSERQKIAFQKLNHPVIQNSELPDRAQQYFIKLNLNLGDINASDLIKVAELAEQYGEGFLRTTQEQDLLICGLNSDELNELRSALNKINPDFLKPVTKIVTCTGAATCKLGLCLSRGLASAIQDELSKSNIVSQQAIRISGCPNSCGGHFIANIGLQGRAQRINGRLMPCYDVLTGGKLGQGTAQLAQRIATIAAKDAPAFLRDALANPSQSVQDILTKFAIPANPPEHYYFDFGSSEPFSLAGRGPGECGAGVTDVIKLDIDEARVSSKMQSKQKRKLPKMNRSIRPCCPQRGLCWLRLD